MMILKKQVIIYQQYLARNKSLDSTSFYYFQAVSAHSIL